MAAHIGHWATGSWIVLGVFLGILALGIALAVLAARGRSSGGARDVLGERLARGEISPEEYRERVAALGPGPRPVLTPIAMSLTAAGLLGAIVVGATSGPGFMHGMMGGGMGSMMGTGETQRSGSAPVAGAREVRVIGREFSLSPAEIRARIGEPVNVLFENRGHMFHTFTIGGLSLDLRANGGDEIAGSFRAERAGEYPFICTVSGHADAGMRGTVIVSE
jgi:plastocyanin